MDDSILCGHCGYPLTYHTSTRVDQECFQAACNALDLMTERLRAFGEGLGITADRIETLQTATPEQLRQVGQVTVKSLDAVVIKQGKEISRLEGLVRMHQDNAASLGEDISVALGYKGPKEDGDALRAWAIKIKQERDAAQKAKETASPSRTITPTDTWNRNLKGGMLAEAYRCNSDGEDEYNPNGHIGFCWRIRIQGNPGVSFVSGYIPTLEEGIKAALKKAVELDLLDEDVLCYKCGLEAEINDGDDASGPPVCCRCYESGQENEPFLG